MFEELYPDCAKLCPIAFLFSLGDLF